MELLPPAAFESSSAKAPSWKDLASEATNEITRLKKDIQHLREEKRTWQQKPREEIHAHVDLHNKIPSVCQHQHQQQLHQAEILSVNASTQRHLEELLQRQATELVTVKSQLEKLQTSHDRDVACWEKDRAISEKRNVERVATLEAELRVKDVQYSEQIDRLSHDHEEDVERLTATLEQTEHELQNERDTSRDTIQRLEKQLNESRTTGNHTIKELEDQLRMKSNEFECLTAEVSRLKTYIGESEKAPTPQQVWKSQKETLENRLQILEAEKESQQSSLELLNVRFSSMSEILSLQETELSKGKSDIMGRGKIESLLLTRWRDKVFALLVQLKSSDIVNKTDSQNWKNKFNVIQDQLDSAQNKIDVLTHSLSDKNAQIEMERNKFKVLNHELTQAQQIALALDDKRSRDHKSMEGLMEYIDSFHQCWSSQMCTLHGVMTTLTAYGQRVSFASGRVDLLKGQFARREALLKFALDEKPVKTDSGETNPQFDDSQKLSSELDRVTRERDQLAAQILADSELLQYKLGAAREHYAEEIATLKTTVEELEKTLQDKSQKCVSLSELLDHGQREYSEQMAQMDTLKTDLARQSIAMEKAHHEQRLRAEDEHRDAMATIDAQLNKAKREHAKAVVSLRQVERQSTRENDRAAEQLKSLEVQYCDQVAHLQMQLQSVEKERNIMLATLRQEGLLGHIRAQRTDPVPLIEEEHREPVLAEQEDVISGESKKPKAASMQSALKDIKALTSAIGRDDESDEEEDESEANTALKQSIAADDDENR